MTEYMLHNLSFRELMRIRWILDMESLRRTWWILLIIVVVAFAWAGYRSR